MRRFNSVILITVIGLAALFSGCTENQGGTPVVTAGATTAATPAVTAGATTAATPAVTTGATTVATPAVTIGAAAATPAVMIGATAAATPTVTTPKPLAIVSQIVSPNSSVKVPIIASGFTNVAAYTISLTYNPAIVMVDSVEAGNLGQVFTTINNSVGVTEMSSFSTTPQSGKVILANITLRAVGTAGQKSPLNLTVATLVDNNGIPLPYTVSNGMFTISAV